MMQISNITGTEIYTYLSNHNTCINPIPNGWFRKKRDIPDFHITIGPPSDFCK